MCWKLGDGFEYIQTIVKKAKAPCLIRPPSLKAQYERSNGAPAKKYNSDEKTRIVLEGLRGQSTIADLCRKDRTIPNVYYKWGKVTLSNMKKR